MNRHFLFLILLPLIFHIAPGSGDFSPNAFAQEEEILSNSRLASKRFVADQWSTKIDAVEAEISFQDDGTYQFQARNSSHEGCRWDGPYTIRRGTLTLGTTGDGKKQCTDGPKDFTSDEKRNGVLKGGKLKNDPASLTYRRFLLFDDGSRFYDETSAPGTEGTAVTVDGIRCVVMGMKKGSTASNVKLRRRPDTGSDEIAFCNGISGDPLRYVPGGTDFTILARTAEKRKVQSWENYWYYVFVGDCGGGNRGWMFGQFVNIR